MTEFKLEPRFFSMLRRRALLIIVLFDTLGLGLGLYVAARHETRPMPWFVWAALLVLLVVAGAIGGLWGMQRAMRSWATYRIVLDEDGVTQVRDHMNVRVLYSEITRINIARGGLVIRTADRFRYIVVPRMLHRFDGLRLELVKRHAIDEIPPAKAARNVALYIAAFVVMLIVMVVFFVATNRYVIIGASIGVLLLPVDMVVVRRRGLASYLSPFRFWFSVIFVTVMALGRIAFAILGK